jgi:hypothetical protein
VLLLIAIVASHPLLMLHHHLSVWRLPVLQRAVAFGLDEEQSFYCGLGEALSRKRRLLADQVAALGFRVLPAEVGPGSS